jgi:hypothetical protein
VPASSAVTGRLHNENPRERRLVERRRAGVRPDHDADRRVPTINGGFLRWQQNVTVLSERPRRP